MISFFLSLLEFINFSQFKFITGGVIAVKTEVRFFCYSMEKDDFFPWTENELEIIEEHEKYHSNMLEYYSNIRKNGPIDPEPRKPGSKLLSAGKKQKLSGKELHNYLLKHIHPRDEFITPKQPQDVEFGSMKKNLQEYVNYLKSLISHTLKFCFEFGRGLEHLKELWEKEKAKGKIKTTWKKWVEKNLHISDRETRKKREMAKILYDYPKLVFLNISCNDFYRRKENIKAMMLTYNEIGQFWKAAM